MKPKGNPFDGQNIEDALVPIWHGRIRARFIDEGTEAMEVARHEGYGKDV